MLLSFILDNLYSMSGILRIVFMIAAVFVILGIGDKANITIWILLYSILQRITIILLSTFMQDFPVIVSIIGLIVEIVLAIIVIVIDVPNGPICLLRGFVFLYETWIVSTLIAGLICGIIVGFSVTELVCVLAIIFILFMFVGG